jgi:aminoglycoside phosphotransferase (APT) family kinase protein
VPSLRVADWRLLLDPPMEARYGRLVVLGGSAGLAEHFAALGLADAVSTALPDDRTANVVVALPPARPTAAALAAALAPDGQLYLEVDRRAAGARRDAATRLCRRLHDAGLSITGAYATLPPDPEAPRRYVPLDRPRAAQWYFRHTYRPLSPAQRITAAGAGLLARAGILMRLAPSFAITARVSGDDPPPLSGPLHGRLPTHGAASRARPIVFAEGGDRVVLLPFGPDDAEPRGVLKVPRLPTFHERTQREVACVRELRAALPAELSRAIPEPIELTTVAGTPVAVERVAPGRSLLASSGSWGAGRRARADDLRLAMTWLARFHATTELRRPAWGDAEREAWVELPIERYAAQFGVTPAEARLFDAARRYADTLAGEPMPIVRQHGDFAVWNLARRGSELFVLDWEGASPGPVLCDALHLVTSWDLALRRARDAAEELRSFDALLRGVVTAGRDGDAYHRVARAALDDYRERVGCGERLVPILLCYHRLELALRRATQQRDARALGADARAGNRPVAHVALLATHAGALFGEAPSTRVAAVAR